MLTQPKSDLNSLELDSFLALMEQYAEPPIRTQISVYQLEKTERGRFKLRAFLEELIGIERADWDFYAGEHEQSANARRNLYAYIEDIRSPFNIGSIIRTAVAFGFSGLGLSELSPHPDTSERVLRSAMGTASHISIFRGTLSDYVQAFGTENVFALETGGEDLGSFAFPKDGIVVLGSEELGVSSELLAYCKSKKGIASIPLNFGKASLNVGVSFGILAQAWSHAMVNS